MGDRVVVDVETEAGMVGCRKETATDEGSIRLLTTGPMLVICLTGQRGYVGAVVVQAEVAGGGGAVCRV